MKLKYLILFTILICTINLRAQNNEDNEKNKYFEGSISSKKGNTVVLIIESDCILPKLKQEGILSLFFEENVFGMKTTGWLDIGETSINSFTKTTVSLTLSKELSVITKNGQKVDHFQKGKKVRFNWKD